MSHQRIPHLFAVFSLKVLENRILLEILEKRQLAKNTDFGFLDVFWFLGVGIVRSLGQGLPNRNLSQVSPLHLLS